MPRPEKPIDPAASPIAAFACALRELRSKAGSPPYREMAKQAHYSVTSLSQAAAGRRLPTWEVTRAFVIACDGDEKLWHQRWEQTAKEITASQTIAAPLTGKPHQGSATEFKKSRSLGPDGGAEQSIRPTTTSGPLGRSGEVVVGNTLQLKRPPDPQTANTPRELMDMLISLYRNSGLTLRELSARSIREPSAIGNNIALSKSHLSALFRSGHLPLRDQLLRIAEVCGATPSDLQDWHHAWGQLTRKPNLTEKPDRIVHELLGAAHEAHQRLRSAEREIKMIASTSASDQQQPREIHTKREKPWNTIRRYIILAALIIVTLAALATAS